MSRAAGCPARGISDGASAHHVPPAAGGGAQAQEHNQVAELGQKPFPPGRYRLIVVGSGPGGLQLSYSLTRLGIDHALLSDDPAPGGMFRRWPVFQRMLSWTKPFTAETQSARAYERYDWNSLLADEGANRALMPGLMDGSSYFPSRPEMQRGLETFASRTNIQVRYGCHWESTRRDEDGFVLTTSDGEYRTPLVVFAVGVAHPYRPPIPGLDEVPHYGDFRPVESYKDHRVFIVGKQNSGFEIATGLLPWARQLVLASPSPTKLSVNTHTLVGVRARYLQPYEDAALAGGVQGHRYNARVLARHLAEREFGLTIPRSRLEPAAVVPYLLDELSRGPELWHQRSYLTRVINLDPDRGITDEGIIPLQHFIDTSGPDAVAVCLESNGQGNPYPVIYLRQGGSVLEHPPLPPHPLLDFSGLEYVRQLDAILKPVLSGTGAPA